ncbi:MAG: hypothetical protein IIA83_09705, partial [Thaumarchaeota archaeon]|nr:hypothetical protein [Nitrososphaerota archaeon]
MDPAIFLDQINNELDLKNKMVFRAEKWAEYKVGAGNYQTFIFRVDKNQSEYQITVNSNVVETGL